MLMSLRMTNRELKVKAANKGAADSLWNKNKPELVEDAVHFLGWTREHAQGQTVGQLRLHLKEFRDEIKGAKPELLPKGLTNMRKSELQEEMQRRSMEFNGMTREQMIRDLRVWAGEAEHGGITGELPTQMMPKEVPKASTNFPNIIRSMATATSSTTMTSKHSTASNPAVFPDTAGEHDSGDSWMDLGGSNASLDASSARTAMARMAGLLLTGWADPQNLADKAREANLAPGATEEQMTVMVNAAVAQAFQMMGTPPPA